MKALLLSALLGSLLLTGCATRYNITLTSGNTITAYSKPRFENGSYVYKDAHGQNAYVSAGRVREIAPNNMSSPRINSGFSAAPTK